MKEREEFTPPPAAKVTTPADSDGEEAPKVDLSRTVAGVGSRKDEIPPPPVEESELPPGLKIGQKVTIPDVQPEPEPEVERSTADGVTLEACPNCGWDLYSIETPEDPTDSDKRAWISHILGEKRFRKEYSLFGGKLKVTLHSRTIGENDDIFNELTEEVTSGEIPNVPILANGAYAMRMHRLMLAYSLEKIEQDGKERKFPELSEDTYPATDEEDKRPLSVRVHDEIIRELPEGLFSVLLDLQRRFEVTLRFLIARGQQSDFWQPTGGQS